MSINDILTTKGTTVHTIDADATLRHAARQLVDHGIGALIVTGPSRELVGIVTEAHLARALADDGDGAARRSIRGLVAPVSVIAPTASVTEAMTTMTNRRTRYLLVHDLDGIRGLVSIGDVVKARLADCELETAVLRDHYLVHH